MDLHLCKKLQRKRDGTLDAPILSCHTAKGLLMHRYGTDTIISHCKFGNGFTKMLSECITDSTGYICHATRHRRHSQQDH